MQKKRLILHIGQHKTGSSALQYFFSKYHEELKKHNIDYPSPESKNVLNTKSCIGNLTKILFEEKIYKQKIEINESDNFTDIWKDEYVVLIKEITENSTCETVIFSAEGLDSIKKRAFEKLSNYLQVFFDVEYVLFVRDPFDLCYSHWKQSLKIYFIQDDFKSYTNNIFLEKSRINMFNIYELVETKPINIKIINYDTYQKDLVKIFIDVTNLKFEIPDQYEPNKIINRSFTDSEASLQLLINREFKNTSFRFLLRLLLLQRDAPPMNSSNQFYDKEIHTIILSHLKNKLIFINKFIYGEPISLEVKKINDSGTHVIQKEDVQVLINAFAYSNRPENKKMNLQSKMSHYYKCISKKNIPLNFNPEAYLMMNQDIKDSGMDPYEHYTKYGVYENRPYKYL